MTGPATGTVRVQLSGDGPVTRVAVLLGHLDEHPSWPALMHGARIEVTADAPARNGKGWLLTLQITGGAR